MTIWLCCHMFSGNCQAGPYLYRITQNMNPPDNYQTTYDSKTKMVVFYSLIIFL